MTTSEPLLQTIPEDHDIFWLKNRFISAFGETVVEYELFSANETTTLMADLYKFISSTPVYALGSYATLDLMCDQFYSDSIYRRFIYSLTARFYATIQDHNKTIPILISHLANTLDIFDIQLNQLEDNMRIFATNDERFMNSEKIEDVMSSNRWYVILSMLILYALSIPDSGKSIMGIISQYID